MEYGKAMGIASKLVEYLEPECERVAIAGSLRRRRVEVHDIEICIALKPVKDLFGYDVNSDIDVSELGNLLKGGQRYKQIELPEGINLDLFIVQEPAQWGVIYAIRTGPASFSQALVTPRKKGGLLPSFARVENGAVYVGRNRLLMPEEEIFFEFCGLPMIDPERRDVYAERKHYMAWEGSDGRA